LHIFVQNYFYSIRLNFIFGGFSILINFMRCFFLKIYSQHKLSCARLCISAVVLLLASVRLSAATQAADSEQNLEYNIKAAFIFNFIKFVDWPAVKEANDVPIKIGIIGKDPFDAAFKPVKDKLVKNRKAIITYFTGYKDLMQAGAEKKGTQDALKSLEACHLLFICSSEKDNMKELINLSQKNNILTVAETSDFLNSGGIIQFLMEDNKVRFEINLIAAKHASLTIRSQLLRLAKRVIEDQPS
jgi:hypothetical protein